MVAMLLLVIGGLNMGLAAATGKDVLVKLFGKQSMILNTILIAIGLAALSIAFYRDTYLPFLGPTVFPCTLVKDHTPSEADIRTSIKLKPGVKVLFWAAEPETKDLATINDWRKAYLGYNNSGVATADNDGNVTLAVRKPQPYMVPFKGMLTPHIHYRVCGDNGMLGRVETIKLDGKEYFENINDEMTDEETSTEMPSDAEGFTNPQTPKADSEFATVPNSGPIDIVEPATAVAEINHNAAMTLAENKMPQRGAYQPRTNFGSDLNDVSVTRLSPFYAI